jgi:hypothetical protein
MGGIRVDAELSPGSNFPSLPYSGVRIGGGGLLDSDGAHGLLLGGAGPYWTARDGTCHLYGDVFDERGARIVGLELQAWYAAGWWFAVSPRFELKARCLERT